MFSSPISGSGVDSLKKIEKIRIAEDQDPDISSATFGHLRHMSSHLCFIQIALRVFRACIAAVISADVACSRLR